MTVRILFFIMFQQQFLLFDRRNNVDTIALSYRDMIVVISLSFYKSHYKGCKDLSRCTDCYISKMATLDVWMAESVAH